MRSQLRSPDEVKAFLANGCFDYAVREFGSVNQPQRHLSWFDWLVRPGFTDELTSAEFAEALESLGLGLELDRRAIRDGVDWLQTRPEHTRLTITMSRDGLVDSRFAQTIVTWVRGADLDPARLCFEVSAHAALQHLSGATRFVKSLRTLGCEIVLSSGAPGSPVLGLFAPLGFVNYVKVNRRWVEAAAHHASTSIGNLHGMLSYANRLGIPVIADGVDSEGILAKLRQAGVHYFQGELAHEPTVVATRTSAAAELRLVG